jgi:hypothetical protein
LEVFRDPRTLAKFNNFDIAVRVGDDEHTTADVIVFTWSRCRRERGIRVLCGLARAYLLRTRTPHNDRDVWLMALELAVPQGALLAGVRGVLVRQRHCPEDVIRAAAALAFTRTPGIVVRMRAPRREPEEAGVAAPNPS